MPDRRMGSAGPCRNLSFIGCVILIQAIFGCSEAAPVKPTSHADPAKQVATVASQPFGTVGRDIVGANGVRLRLKCASWSGGQEKWYAPSGLWAQNRKVIASMAKQSGLNCIRLVWSLELALKPGAAPPKDALLANPDLVGKTALQVFDAVVKAIADAVSSGVKFWVV